MLTNQYLYDRCVHVYGLYPKPNTGDRSKYPHVEEYAEYTAFSWPAKWSELVRLPSLQASPWLTTTQDDLPRVGPNSESLRASLFDTYAKRCASVSKGVHAEETPLSNEATEFLSEHFEAALEVCRLSQTLAQSKLKYPILETVWRNLIDRLLLSSFKYSKDATVDQKGRSFVLYPQ